MDSPETQLVFTESNNTDSWGCEGGTEFVGMKEERRNNSHYRWESDILIDFRGYNIEIRI